MTAETTDITHLFDDSLDLLYRQDCQGNDMSCSGAMDSFNKGVALLLLCVALENVEAELGFSLMSCGINKTEGGNRLAQQP